MVEWKNTQKLSKNIVLHKTLDKILMKKDKYNMIGILTSNLDIDVNDYSRKIFKYIPFIAKQLNVNTNYFDKQL